jgi:hypothetical protein
MRCYAFACVLLTLASCGERRTFDERYDNTEEQLEAKIRNLDSNLTSDLSNSNQAAGNGSLQQPSSPD